MDLQEKLYEHGNIIRNKAKLFAQGCTQVERLDFEETFAPGTRLEIIRLLLFIVCQMGFKLYQMNVKSVFLNGTFNEEAYVKQPK